MLSLMYARDVALIATPIGRIRIVGTDRLVESVSIEAMISPVMAPQADAIRQAAIQLEAWFAGEREDFDLPLAPAATSRGDALRRAMIDIPYAMTMSYGELARSIASSARAIGQACARNPFPIIVPCHRVLNADRSLGAYSAGKGSVTKRWLLDHEQRTRGN